MPEGPKPLERIAIIQMELILSILALQIFFKSFPFGDIKQLE